MSSLDFIYQRVQHFGISVEKLKGCLQKTADVNNESIDNIINIVSAEINNIEKSCVSTISKSPKITLKDYQKRVVEYMFTHRGIVVSFDVGKGKTLTAIASAHCLTQQAKMFGQDIKVYIITPTSLVDNFKKEMRKFGIDPDRSNYEFYTITGFSNAYKKKEIQCKNSLIIIDEAHNLRKDFRMEFAEFQIGCKEEDATRASKFIKCCQKAWKVILLTANPAYNATHDIVNLAAMVSGKPLLTNSQFKELMKNDDKFNEYFGCMFAFEKAPSDKFPKRIDEFVYIKMTPEYYKKYMDAEKGLVKKGGTKDTEKASNAFMCLMRKSSNDLSPCLKCDYIMNLLGNGLKTIVYSEYKSSGIDLITKKLDDMNVKYYTITGSVPKNKRGAIVENLNSGKVNILFITKAGGEGLDLKGVRQIILMEKGWNTATEEQVIGRGVRYESHTHLPKNEQDVTVYHLIITKPKEYDQYKMYGRVPTPTQKYRVVARGKHKGEKKAVTLKTDDKPSADLYMFRKSRAKKIAIDELMNKLEKCSLGRYKCDIPKSIGKDNTQIFSVVFEGKTTGYGWEEVGTTTLSDIFFLVINELEATGEYPDLNQQKYGSMKKLEAAYDLYDSKGVVDYDKTLNNYKSYYVFTLKKKFVF